MEALRPLADAYVLADTLNAWAGHAAPLAENLAHTFAASSSARLPRLTPLTRRNQREALDQRMPYRRTHRPAGTTLALPKTCPDCGGPIGDRRRSYCDDCRAIRIARRGDRGRETAQAVLAQLRAEQRDPAHGGRAAQIRGTKNAAHQRAVHAWTGQRPDPTVFTREILPGLRQQSLHDLMAATGLSEHYCSLIRLGKRIPHPRHWSALSHVGVQRDE